MCRGPKDWSSSPRCQATLWRLLRGAEDQPQRLQRGRINGRNVFTRPRCCAIQGVSQGAASVKEKKRMGNEVNPEVNPQETSRVLFFGL